MADVFMSFIHEEDDLARAVQRYLWEEFRQFSAHWTIFLSADSSQLLPGQDWLETIDHELKTAAVVILMLSQSSVKRPWVNFEAGAAWLRRKHIIPQLPQDWNSLVWAVATYLGRPTSLHPVCYKRTQPLGSYKKGSSGLRTYRRREHYASRACDGGWHGSRL